MTYTLKPAEVSILAKCDQLNGSAIGEAIKHLQAGTLSAEAFTAWSNAREAAARASAGGGGKISFKVGRKGGVCVYGLQRNPVTLYAEQWERLLAPSVVKDLLAYIASDPSTHHEAKDGEPAVTARLQRKNGIKAAA